MPSLFDPDFRYVPAARTDLKKKFAQVRKKLKEEAESRQRDEDEKVSKVRTMKVKA